MKQKSLMQQCALFLFTILISLSNAGCLYMENRGKDLTEAANIKISILSVGLGVNAGPFIAGYHKNEGIMGGAGVGIKFGLGGMYYEKIRGAYSGIVIPLSHSKLERNKEKEYCNNPGWGSAGFDLGYIIGLGTRVDVIEFIDFLGGIFLIDILKDDSSDLQNYKIPPDEKKK